MLCFHLPGKSLQLVRPDDVIWGRRVERERSNRRPFGRELRAFTAQVPAVTSGPPIVDLSLEYIPPLPESVAVKREGPREHGRLSEDRRRAGEGRQSVAEIKSA